MKTMDSRKFVGSLAVFLTCLLAVIAILPQQETLAQQTSPTATWTPYVLYVTATPTRTAGGTVVPQPITADTQAPLAPPQTMEPSSGGTPAGGASAAMPDATPIAETGESPSVRIALTDLGYESPATASGVRANSTVYFPLPPGGISGGVLTLYLSVSPLLNPLSSIRVDIDGEPTATFFVDELGEETTLTYPVEPLQKKSLRVSLSGQLFVGDDLCFDQDGTSLWFAVRENSELVYTPNRTGLATIQEFLTQEVGNIRVHGLWDTPDHQASSIALFSVLKYIYRDTQSHVLLVTESASTAPAVEEDSLPTSEVWLVDSPDAPPVRLNGNRLEVTNDRKALLELVSQAGKSLQLGHEVTVLKRVPPLPLFPRDAEGLSDYRLYLSDMGIGNQERQGFTGEFSMHVRFTPADFGGWPADLRFSLDSVFDPVPTDTLERTYLRLRLNGRLLESFDIRGKTALRTRVSLPSEALEAENDLKVSFAYAPEAGFCYGAPWEFTGQVLDSSYFTWSRYATSPRVFAMLLGRMSGEGQIFLIDDSTTTAQAAAQLIGDLSQYTAQPLMPTLTDAAALESEQGDANYRIVVGGERKTLRDIGLPISVNGEVEIVDTIANRIILEGSSDQPLVVAQYAANEGPVLGFQVEPSTNAEALMAAVSRMTDPETFFDLAGNVVVGTASETIAFDPSLSDVQIRSLAPVEVEPTWLDVQKDRLERNRLPLALLLIAFIIALSLLIARRMGRRLPPPAPHED